MTMSCWVYVVKEVTSLCPSYNVKIYIFFKSFYETCPLWIESLKRERVIMKSWRHLKSQVFIMKVKEPWSMRASQCHTIQFIAYYSNNELLIQQIPFVRFNRMITQHSSMKESATFWWTYFIPPLPPLFFQSKDGIRVQKYKKWPASNFCHLSFNKKKPRISL